MKSCWCITTSVATRSISPSTGKSLFGSDWTTNGTTNPVVESGTVWIAWAWSGIVVGNDVCCYIDWTCVWTGFTIRWMQKRITVVLMQRDTWHVMGRWYVRLLVDEELFMDSDPIAFLMTLLTDTWRCVNLFYCRLVSRGVDALRLNVRMSSPLNQIISREEKETSSNRFTS